jgi:hypothetical protein
MDIDDFGNKDKRLSVQLATTEAAVLAAASRIYAAYINNGEIDEANEKALTHKAIKQALIMAKIVDDAIKAEGEF